MEQTVTGSSVFGTRTANDLAHLAALKRPPAKRTKRRKIFLLFAQANEGLTDNEIVAKRTMLAGLALGHRGALVEGEWIRDKGMRRVNDRGHLCVVWELTAKGKKYFAEEGP